MPRTRNVRGVAVVAAAVLAGATLTACDGSPSPVLLAPTSPGTPPADTQTPSLQIATPTPTPATPAEALVNARELFAAGEYTDAAAAYLAVARTNGDGATVAEALVGLAVTRNADGDLQGALAAAAQAVDAAPTGSAIAINARYLRGRYLADDGRFADAAEALGELADDGTGPLQPFVLADLQGAALGAGDADLAASASERLALEPGVPPGVLQAAQRRNVLAAFTVGDRETYAAELEKLVAITGSASDRFDLADVYGQLGREADRTAVLHAITLATPSDPLASAAVQSLEEVGETVPPLLKGFIYYRGHRYTDAVETLAPAVEARDALAPEDQAFATYYLAAALEEQGYLADAVALYDQVPGLAPDSPWAHRARYWAARILESLQEFPSASARYVELVNLEPSGEFDAEGAFRSGYVLYAAGDPAGAAAAWSALGETNARVLYWRGLAQRAAGDEAAATASFDAAIAAGPLDFHGVEAARLTGALGPLDTRYRERDLAVAVDWAELEAWVTSIAGPRPAEHVPTAAAALVALGLPSEAADTVLASAGTDPWEALDAAREAHDLGLKGTAARLAERLRWETGIGWHEAPRALLALAHPVAFPALLDREARERDIDPLFLAALVRTESFWEPSAVSWVGALGLAQVMPETGAAIATELGVAGFETSDLLRPVTSLRFGAYYIGEQIRAFGQAFVALSAYNGGPARAARWIETWDGQSAASYAEAVDIEETRNYVELVLEAYARYDAVYPAVSR